jgi:hypothetical protein
VKIATGQAGKGLAGIRGVLWDDSQVSPRRPKVTRRATLEISDETELTQYGTRSTSGGHIFRKAPRYPLETEISLLIGPVPLGTAELLVRKARVGGGEVRSTTAGLLRKAGFRVAHTPTRGNPIHASAFFDGDWTSAIAEAFDACFTEPRGE